MITLDFGHSCSPAWSRLALYIQFVEQQNEHFILSACIAVSMASLDYVTTQIAHVSFLRQQKAIALVEIMLSTGHH